MGKSPEKPQRKLVINNIGHLNTIGNLFDKMFVVPKRIRDYEEVLGYTTRGRNVEDYLSQLNEAQQEPTTHVDGPLMVIARNPTWIVRED